MPTWMLVVLNDSKLHDQPCLLLLVSQTDGFYCVPSLKRGSLAELITSTVTHYVSVLLTVDDTAWLIFTH